MPYPEGGEESDSEDNFSSYDDEDDDMLGGVGGFDPPGGTSGIECGEFEITKKNNMKLK